ncbi:MAG: biotin transporter BioY [Lachnospiraceae bacterium]|nr:biotin transporter BioY [Lachnospiraceae bacterium]
MAFILNYKDYMMNRKNELTIYHLTGIGLMSAVICILGPITIPIGMVPIGFTGIGIYISLFLLGKKKTVSSVFIYLLTGMVGLPVFSGFTTGPGKLFGPTGGYLWGYLLSAYVCGLLLEREKKKNLSAKRKYFAYFMILFWGNLILYLTGSIWLSQVSQLTMGNAVKIGVLPFILPDLLKNIIAISLGTELKKRLRNVEM